MYDKKDNFFFSPPSIYTLIHIPMAFRSFYKVCITFTTLKILKKWNELIKISKGVWAATSSVRKFCTENAHCKIISFFGRIPFLVSFQIWLFSNFGRFAPFDFPLHLIMLLGLQSLQIDSQSSKTWPRPPRRPHCSSSCLQRAKKKYLKRPCKAPKLQENILS